MAQNIDVDNARRHLVEGLVTRKLACFTPGQLVGTCSQLKGSSGDQALKRDRLLYIYDGVLGLVKQENMYTRDDYVRSGIPVGERLSVLTRYSLCADITVILPKYDGYVPPWHVAFLNRSGCTTGFGWGRLPPVPLGVFISRCGWKDRLSFNAQCVPRFDVATDGLGVTTWKPYIRSELFLFEVEKTNFVIGAPATDLCLYDSREFFHIFDWERASSWRNSFIKTLVRTIIGKDVMVKLKVAFLSDLFMTDVIYSGGYWVKFNDGWAWFDLSGHVVNGEVFGSYYGPNPCIRSISLAYHAKKFRIGRPYHTLSEFKAAVLFSRWLLQEGWCPSADYSLIHVLPVKGLDFSYWKNKICPFAVTAFFRENRFDHDVNKAWSSLFPEL